MKDFYVVKSGQGPLVVLSHALGCDVSMWDGVAEQLSQSHTVLRYDHRGHGRSWLPTQAFTMADLADDAAELIRAHAGQQPVHFVGLSMGGMTGQALAARHPQLLASLVIANSAAYYDEAARAMWQARIQTVLGQGVAAIGEGAMQRWFTPEFRADHGGAARVAALRVRLEACQPQAYAYSCAAVAGIDFRESNRKIQVPTLVISGLRDEATPPAMAHDLARAIPGARLADIDAAHLSAVEQPQAFARLLTEFWGRLP